MASNDNSKHKLEDEAESSMMRKRLQLSDDDDDSSDLSKEMEEEEVSLEESSMNQVDTSEKKLLAKCGSGMVFSDDGDTTSPSSEPRSPKSRVSSDLDGSDKDDDDDFWM
jgi:hypothetical protein